MVLFYVMKIKDGTITIEDVPKKDGKRQCKR